MNDIPKSIDSISLVQPIANDDQLLQFEQSLTVLLDSVGLPTRGIFVPIDERQVVFGNMPRVIARIDADRRSQSIYFSKFMAAVASGLFDAALNYLWDETISELRKRVANYDLSYFYDSAVKNAEKRKRLTSEEDLVKLDDFELIQGAREIELISALGYQHLDYIRFMRNWASAAHPNHNEISGIQLSMFAETCIREVIALPPSEVVTKIQRLLSNVRSNTIDEPGARQISAFFSELNREQVGRLANGLFGIYTRVGSGEQARQNVRRLLPNLWSRVDNETRIQFGVRYGQFVANNDQDQQKQAREFLEIVSAAQYVPAPLRAVEVATAVEDLVAAHRGHNNFYAEPPLARELQRLIGVQGEVPSQVQDMYTLGLVEVYLTNGSGAAWSAEPIYRELIQQFTPEQALKAILSFQHETIAGRLRFERCQKQFRTLLEILKSTISLPAVVELIEYVESYTGPLDKMNDDDQFRNRLKPYLTIMM